MCTFPPAASSPTSRRRTLFAAVAGAVILWGLGVSGASAEEPASTVQTPAAESASGSGTLQIPGVSLGKRFAQGGLTMYAIVALSLVMVTFGAERFFLLRRSRICPEGLADRARAAWSQGNMTGVIQAAESQPSVLGSAILVLARHPHFSATEASTIVGDEVSRLMRKHLQRAYPLAIVATLSPLLGLLGTVTGMIDAFEVVAIAGSLGDASLLAGGIAKALITTAFGLIVAIPALGLYHFFRGKTHELAMEAEEQVEELLGEWFYTPGAESREAR